MFTPFTKTPPRVHPAVGSGLSCTMRSDSLSKAEVAWTPIGGGMDPEAKPNDIPVSVKAEQLRPLALNSWEF